MVAPMRERQARFGPAQSKDLGRGSLANAVRSIRNLRSHPFMRGLAVVVGGTAAAQAITFAFSPVITRLYGPEVFGVQGIFLSIVGIVTPFASLGYGGSIVLPASDGEARALFRLSMIISAAMSALSAIVVGIFHAEIADAIGFTAASSLLFLLPIVVLMTAIAQPFHHWLARKKQFASLSRISIAEAVLVGTGKSAAGVVAATAPVLLASVAISGGLKVWLMWRSARSTLLSSEACDRAEPAAEAEASLRSAAYRFRDFPLFRAPLDWLNAASYGIPSLMLASLLGPAAAGFYVLAFRVVSLPITIIAAAVGTVFLPRIAEASHRSEPLRPLLLKGTAALAAFGIVPFGIMMVFGPWIFSFVFGADWAPAGEYARWLALWFYFIFIGAPSTQAFPILGLQGHFLAYEVVVTILRTASLAVGVLLLRDEMAAIALFAIVGVLVNVAQILWCILSCDRRLRSTA
ncbi:O-antigen/teichoic acid export membrane protein [Microvirga subterranea]|uniref:O-antigen/teichoic acid export membrane protein n=2 Tax=Microvirga subterranea TaxID=186651 RepID=A0A370H7D1_9HYPH|nr:O-antigen/teichoic acid export membrane protein [Microvirga subterranea]